MLRSKRLLSFITCLALVISLFQFGSLPARAGGPTVISELFVTSDFPKKIAVGQKILYGEFYSLKTVGDIPAEFTFGSWKTRKEGSDWFDAPSLTFEEREYAYWAEITLTDKSYEFGKGATVTINGEKWQTIKVDKDANSIIILSPVFTPKKHDMGTYYQDISKGSVTIENPEVYRVVVTLNAAITEKKISIVEDKIDLDLDGKPDINLDMGHLFDKESPYIVISAVESETAAKGEQSIVLGDAKSELTEDFYSAIILKMPGDDPSEPIKEDLGEFIIDFTKGSVTINDEEYRAMSRTFTAAIDDKQMRSAGPALYNEEGFYLDEDDSIDFTVKYKDKIDDVIILYAGKDSSAKGAHSITFPDHIKHEVGKYFYSKITFIFSIGKTVYDHDKGTLEIDLTGGGSDIVGDAWFALGTSLTLIEMNGSDPMFKKTESYDGNIIDLDKDGTYDIVYDRSSISGVTWNVLKTSSIKGNKWTISLLDETIKEQNSYEQSGDFYSKIVINFPSNPEVIGKTLKYEPGKYDVGEYTIDFTKGPFIMGFGLYQTLAVTFSGAFNGGQIHSFKTDESGVDGVYLDKNDSIDFYMDFGKGAGNDVTFFVGEDNSVKGTFTITWPKTVTPAKGAYYYSKINIIFDNGDTSGNPDDPSKSKDPASGDAAKDGSKAPTVQDPAAAHKVGDVVSDNGASYRITSVDDAKPTVTYTKTESGTATSATIPDTVTIDNKTFNVTEIAANAFKGNKKLKKITIGKNIVKIGSKAFYKCANLKSIKIKSTSLTKKTIGTNAFKGIHPKAKVKVPAKQLKSYRKALKARGINGKSQKITK